MSWQFQYAGPNLQNLRLLVCRECLDIPQPQLKPRILPPDPTPTLSARPENFDIDDMDWIVTDDQVIIAAQDGSDLIEQNDANYRGNDPLPVPEPPIISGSYINADGDLLIADNGQYLIVGGN